MAIPKVLLVDDDPLVRETLEATLQIEGFHVTAAGDVNEALRYIGSSHFDVLVSDLHMPGAADGLTVISAMRHAHPTAVTLLLSAFPEMEVAVRAMFAQTDQVLLKPLGIRTLASNIRARLASEAVPVQPIESVATILERSIVEILNAWYGRVEKDTQLMALPLDREQRTGHISQVLLDLVHRLRSRQPLGGMQLCSVAARSHGQLRRTQGYSAAMMVDESRMLQVSVFETLNANIDCIDFGLLLTSVMTIADEVDSQLSQAMKSYWDEYVSETPFA